MLIYSVCYYYGKNKKSNIQNHLTQFLKIEQEEKEFIIEAMIDSHNTHVFSNVVDELYGFIKEIDNDIKFIIIPNFNWGGTILGLWLAYQYSKKNTYKDDTYIAHFEEDFFPVSNKWFSDSKQILHNKENYIYIGESTKGCIKKKNDDDRLSSKYYKNSVRLGNPEVWTDGGYYFSTLKNYKEMESKIGIFHKGDPNTLRSKNYILDGIDLGEVGFPTILYHVGLRFGCLLRKNYFIHDR